MKIKFITTRKNHIQEGFGLLETTCAALLSLLFVSMGANLVLTANLFKIKAKRADVMNSLIRADIESIKYQSTKLQSNKTNCAPSKLSEGFAWELKNNIGVDSATSNSKTTTIKILGSNYVLTRDIDLDTDANRNPKADPIIDPDILPLSYSFARKKDPGESGSPPSEYNLTVQIIPNASLKCSTTSP